MARLADEVGVSRQTVYNEIGTKSDLAEAVVLRELDRFLAGVVRSFDENPDDLIQAIRDSPGGCSSTPRTTRSCTPSCPPPTAPTPSCCPC